MSIVDTEPIFVSFYTPGTPYEVEARGLVESLDAHGLEHDVVAEPHRGDWTANQSRKPAVVLAAAQRHPGRALVWVDADARVLEVPEFLLGLPPLLVDIAVRHRTAPHSGKEETLSGTVFFGATRMQGAILALWKARCEASPRAWDQAVLAEVLDQLRAEIVIRELPPSYCHIFDDSPRPDPVHIEHFQASRKYRHKLHQ